MAASAASREITWASFQELDHLVGRQPLRRALLLHGGPEMQETDEALVLGQADRGPPLGRAQHLRGAPVGGEAASVGGEQDDVCGAGGGVKILLVLGEIAGEGA